MANRHITIGMGEPGTPGAFCRGKHYYFTISIPEPVDAELLIYDCGKEEPLYTIPLTREDRIGWVNAICVRGMDKNKYEYLYRIKGKLVVDPAAPAVDIVRDKNTGKLVQRGVVSLPPAYREDRPDIAMSDSIFYKLHVKGFTMGKYSGVEHKGTFLGLQEKLPYLKELGVTSLLLMPSYDFFIKEEVNGIQARDLPEDHGQILSAAVMDADQEKKAKTDPSVLVDPFLPIETQKKNEERYNYWGYANGLYMAPKRRYAANRDVKQEFADLVNAVHAEDMELLMEFYFDETVTTGYILKVLHAWLLNYGVDGFHLVGRSSWSQVLFTDPILKECKILTEYPKPHELPEIPGQKKICGAYNLSWQQTMRCFLKGDAGCVGPAAEQLRKNTLTSAPICYMVDQDGYTLNDLVTYQKKYNEDNGEANRDGRNDNLSWNCGAEGPSRKKAVLTLRERQMKNAILMMLTSQGTPMLYAGDESCNTQNGNNNAWCQDNPTGWVDWKNSRISQRILDFTKKAIAFRKEHPILHMEGALRMQDYKRIGYPDISYHAGQGWVMAAEEESRQLGILYNEAYAEEKPEAGKGGLLYIIYNMHWEEQSFALPSMPLDKVRWELLIDTNRMESFLPQEERGLPEDKKEINVPPRSIMVLTGRQ